MMICDICGEITEDVEKIEIEYSNGMTGIRNVCEECKMKLECDE